MNVTVLSMDSAYSLSRLGIMKHQHLHHVSHLQTCQPERHVESCLQEQPEPADVSTLSFSVVNILRPDFGKNAILNMHNLPKTIPINEPTFPIQNTLSFSRDLTFSTSRLLPISSSRCFGGIQKDTRDIFSSHSSLTSPVQRHMSSLSRSGSLESLASNRSSITGGSIIGTASLSSATSTTGTESLNGDSNANSLSMQNSANGQSLWPAWIYCTRYSDRPSSGPRTRRIKRSKSEKSISAIPDEKRPRTAFSTEQLNKLKLEFKENRYLTEPRRQKLSTELGLNEQQIKIWFQNKRAKIKKASGQKNPLALQLMAQGLYNHSTMSINETSEEIITDQ